MARTESDVPLASYLKIVATLKIVITLKVVETLKVVATLKAMATLMDFEFGISVAGIIRDLKSHPS
jgi:hypothetical protein